MQRFGVKRLGFGRNPEKVKWNVLRWCVQHGANVSNPSIKWIRFKPVSVNDFGQVSRNRVAGCQVRRGEWGNCTYREQIGIMYYHNISGWELWSALKIIESEML